MVNDTLISIFEEGPYFSRNLYIYMLKIVFENRVQQQFSCCRFKSVQVNRIMLQYHYRVIEYEYIEFKILVLAQKTTELLRFQNSNSIFFLENFPL